MNCTFADISETRLINLSVLSSSKGASTSSSKQNGAGLIENKENTKARAVSAFSPPESCDNFVFFFPGSLAIKTKPLSSESSNKFNFENPPTNNFGNISSRNLFTEFRHS